MNVDTKKRAQQRERQEQLRASISPAEEVNHRASFRGGLELFYHGELMTTGERVSWLLRDEIATLPFSKVVEARGRAGLTGGELKIARIDGKVDRFDMLEPKELAPEIAAWINQHVS